MAYKFEPTPGPQNPGKYPAVGPRYRKYGEVAGWFYNYIDDSYHQDPNAQKAVLEGAGIKEDKPPSAGNQLATTLGGTAAGIGTAVLVKTGVERALADSPKPDVSGGLIGSGKTGATVATGATAPTPGGGVASQAGAGLAKGGGGSVVNPNGTVTAPDGVIVDPKAGTAINPDGTAVEGVNIGPYIQGAIGVLQAYNAAQSWKEGDKVGAGLNAAGAVANVGGALGNATLGAAAPFVGLATGAYNYKKLFDVMGDAPKGGETTRNMAVQGFTTGGLVGAAIGAIGSQFGSGKDKNQMGRDAVRKYLVDQKVVDKADYTIKFADGSTFDIGKDGGARLTNNEGKERQYSDVDFNDPRAGMVVGSVNPLAAIITGGNKKLSSDFAGEYTNAVLAGGGDDSAVNARIRELYAKHNITAADASKIIDQLVADKKVDAQTGASYKNGINVVFGATPPKLSQPVPAPGTVPGVAPLQPGQTAASTAAVAQNGGLMGSGTQAAPAQPAASGGLIPPRSGTSPGFDRNGRRINYGNA
jgi:hypothetical protein